MSHTDKAQGGTKDTVEQDEPFWLDYLEGELEKELEEDAGLLLTHSEQNRKAVLGLQKTKDILKASDEDFLPEDGLFYQRLHDKIMEKVAQTKVEAPKKWKWSKAARLPSFLMMSGLFALALAVLSSYRSAPSDAVLEASLKDPSALFATVLPEEMEGDFLFETVEKKMENMDRTEVEGLIDSAFN